MTERGEEDRPDRRQIAVVGPCAAGKSTLVAGLRARGFQARQIAQEHSFVPEMWQVLAKPDVLVFLDASFQTCERRKHLNWRPKDHAEQMRRLAHARAHCDIYVETEGLTPEQVLQQVLTALQRPAPR